MRVVANLLEVVPLLLQEVRVSITLLPVKVTVAPVLPTVRPPVLPLVLAALFTPPVLLNRVPVVVRRLQVAPPLPALVDAFKVPVVLLKPAVKQPLVPSPRVLSIQVFDGKS